MKINARINGDGYHKDADGPWQGEYHRFKVTLTFDRRKMSLTFHQGTGIENDPTVADILECVLSDYIDSESTFEEWAADFGYDTDSRTAEKIYQACQEQSQQFETLMGESLPTILRNCDEDGTETVMKRWAGVTK